MCKLKEASKSNIMTSSFVVGKAQTDVPHIPSTLQADTLFHFMNKLDWLIKALERKQLTARYHTESLEYFNIEELKKYAIPMKCFCDINLHNLKAHVDWYGAYGIAFSKEWGMNKGIQPVQYINCYSPLCQDMAEAFDQTLSSDISKEASVREYLESFMLLQLMFWKPYQGPEKKDEIIREKCYSDESEWRFIPDLSNTDMPMVIKDENLLRERNINNYNETLEEIESASLHFEYNDIKYIILKSKSDFSELLSKIDSWNVEPSVRDEIISKVIIWDESREDF